MAKSRSGPDKMIDINKGVRELLTSAKIKSVADLQSKVAECCIQACDCCLQVSRAAQGGRPAELSGTLRKLVVDSGHKVR